MIAGLAGPAHAQGAQEKPAAPAADTGGAADASSASATSGENVAPALLEAGASVQDPRGAQAAYEKASRLRDQKKPAQALKSLDASLRKYPRDPRMRFLYAVILDEEGRGEEAIDVLVQLTQDYPELPEPYNNLAVLKAARGDLDGARMLLEQALQALPTYSLARENLGDVYARLAERAWREAAVAGRLGNSARTKLERARQLFASLAGEPTTAAPQRLPRPVSIQGSTPGSTLGATPGSTLLPDEPSPKE
jgi:Flp pilus assembly protein TadD